MASQRRHHGCALGAPVGSRCRLQCTLAAFVFGPVLGFATLRDEGQLS